MKPFDYLKPGSMNDAIGALKEHDHPVLLAGGTDLLVAMKSNTVKTACLVDLKGIPGIDAVEYDDGFNIGPMATVREIETSPLIREKLPALSQAAPPLGTIQITNRATVGGNLSPGSPAADMAAILLAMDGEVSIASASGERRVKLEQFFTGPGSTAVGAAEVLVGIHIPEEVANYRGVYLKHGPRRAMDIGIVNIALLLDVDFTSGICNRIMLAMGAVGPTPLRAARAEEMLNGNRLTPELINQASEAASKEAQPITDFRASADYRRAMIVSLVSKGINQILASGSAC
jgi:CO/xanthine dehydrogenase FAD-binding subunit